MEIISKYIISGKTGLQSTSELLSKKKFELVKSHQIGLQQLESVKTAYYSKLAELFCQLEIQFQDAIQQSQDNLKSPEENYTQCSDKVHLVEKSLGEGDLDIRTMELLFESVLQIEEIVSMIQAVKNPTLRTLLCRLGIQDIGYLETDGVEPADFILVVETEQAEAVVGAQINLSINSRTSKELNESCLEKLKVSTKCQTWTDSSEVEVKGLLLADGHSKIIFSFLPQKGGLYTVSVCLYEQHISGSPCTLPIYTMRQPSYVQQLSHVQLSPVKCDSSTSTPIKANPGLASTSGGVLATESGDISCSASSTTKAYPGVSNAGRRLFSSTLKKVISYNKKLEKLNETETKIPEGKDEYVSMFGDNAAQVHSKHSEEASSSRLPEIVSPVATISTDHVDCSAPQVDDSFGGARPKTYLSTSSSEASSPEEDEENLDEFFSVADILPKDKDVADPPGKDEGVAYTPGTDEFGAYLTEDVFPCIFLNHHAKELRSSGGLSGNLKLMNLYTELEKWNTGDIGYFQGTVKVVVQNRSANCLIVKLLDGSIKSVSPFTLSSILVDQAVKPESKYADALDYSSDESNSADSSESEVSSPRIPGTRLLVRLRYGVDRPIGVAADSSYVYIVCKDSQSIRKFTKRGDFVKEYLEYPKPRQLLHLKQGGFVLTCKQGLVFLTTEFTQIKVVEGKYSGIAQDDNHRIITLVERKRETDQQIAVINLENYVIESKIMVSKVNSCKWITYDRGSLYLSCPGLHKVVKVNMDGRILGEMVSLDSEDPVNTEYEFAVVKMDPAEVVVLDSSGTMLVADSKNNRVQVYNAEYECLGSLDIPEMSLGPCGMHLDTLNRILYLTCHWSNSTLVLQLVQF